MSLHLDTSENFEIKSEFMISALISSRKSDADVGIFFSIRGIDGMVPNFLAMFHLQSSFSRRSEFDQLAITWDVEYSVQGHNTQIHSMVRSLCRDPGRNLLLQPLGHCCCYWQAHQGRIAPEAS